MNKEKLPVMRIAYRSETGLGLAMRLRQGLGKAFALQFIPIGMKRTREEKVVEGERPKKKKGKVLLLPEEEKEREARKSKILDLLLIYEEEEREEQERIEEEARELTREEIEEQEEQVEKREKKTKRQRKKRKKEEKARKIKREWKIVKERRKIREKKEKKKGPFRYLYPWDPQEEEERQVETERLRQKQREQKGLLDPEEEERLQALEEKRPLLVPEEVAFLIHRAMFTSPARENARDLFNYAMTTKTNYELFQDTSEHLEKAASLSLLGVAPTRSRIERKVGLEPDVAKRYRWVLSFLNRSPQDIQKLQIKADKNIKRAKFPTLVKHWPWWLFDLYSNWRTRETISEQFSRKSDAFTSSIVTIEARLTTEEETTTVRDSFQMMSPNTIRSITKRQRQEFATSQREWEAGSSGATVVVIPLDEICERALAYAKTVSKMRNVMDIERDVAIFIISSEAMEEYLSKEEIYNRASFKKEVIFTGIENLKKKILVKAVLKNIRLHLDLSITYAFLPKQTIEFLENLSLCGKINEYPNLDIENLRLEQVYFDGRTHFSGISPKTLQKLSFGPSNLTEAPLLTCPAQALKKLTLNAFWKEGSILKWSINSAQDYPQLENVILNHNVIIWEEPTIKSIPDLPRLRAVQFGNFQGSVEAAISLVKAFEEMAIRQIERKQNVSVAFIRIRPDKRRPEIFEAMRDHFNWPELQSRGLNIIFN